jgi:HEAT repeat protein
MKRALQITFGIAALVAASMSLHIAFEWTWPKLPQPETPQFTVYEVEIPAAGPATARDNLTLANVTAQLDDPHPAVREDAVERLAELGGTEAIAGLGYALSDQSDTVRRLAIEGLVNIGSDEAIAALVLVLDDPDVDLRELAVDELADVGTESALTLLQAFVADQDPRVRELAQNRLF